jgi:hypothetical protein
VNDRTGYLRLHGSKEKPRKFSRLLEAIWFIITQ